MAERLQKIIAESGLMSRRAAELAISEGRVLVNGLPAKLGDRAESSDRITLDGEAFQYYDASIAELAPRAGRYQILYGTSSLDKDLKALDFVVK